MTKHEILNAINKQLLDSTNYLIQERKQHNQNYYESIVKHRELLLLYNDINETNDITEEQMKRYKELI